LLSYKVATYRSLSDFHEALEEIFAGYKGFENIKTCLLILILTKTRKPRI